MNAFSLHYLVSNTKIGEEAIIRRHRVFAPVNNTAEPQINNRRGRRYGSAAPGTTEPEPEGDRSSAVLLCNSGRNQLSANPL